MKTEPDLLILKFLQGSISETEKRELLNWSELSETNKKVLEDSVAVWRLTQAVPLELDFSSKEEWEKLTKNLGVPESTSDPISISLSRNNHWWLTGLAASLAVLLISYFTIFKKEQQHVIYAANNKIIEAKLPDGSNVWLNEKSTLEFEKNFSGDAREVALKGEAYFEVRKDDQKPFLVHTGNVTTKVVGTSFHIKSKTAMDTTEIRVISGKVLFFSDVSPERGVTLKAGMKGIYLSSSDSVYAIIYTEDNALAWQHKKLIFNNSTIDEVLEQLRNHYKVDIKVKEDSILNCKFTSTFENASIHDILNVLVLSLNLQYVQEGDKFLIKGRGCDL